MQTFLNRGNITLIERVCFVQTGLKRNDVPKMITSFFDQMRLRRLFSVPAFNIGRLAGPVMRNN